MRFWWSGDAIAGGLDGARFLRRQQGVREHVDDGAEISDYQRVAMVRLASVKRQPARTRRASSSLDDNDDDWRRRQSAR